MILRWPAIFSCIDSEHLETHHNEAPCLEKISAHNSSFTAPKILVRRVATGAISTTAADETAQVDTVTETKAVLAMFDTRVVSGGAVFFGLIAATLSDARVGVSGTVGVPGAPSFVSCKGGAGSRDEEDGGKEAEDGDVGELHDLRSERIRKESDGEVSGEQRVMLEE